MLNDSQKKVLLVLEIFIQRADADSRFFAIVPMLPFSKPFTANSFVAASRILLLFQPRYCQMSACDAREDPFFHLFYKNFRIIVICKIYFITVLCMFTRLF